MLYLNFRVLYCAFEWRDGYTLTVDLLPIRGPDLMLVPVFRFCLFITGPKLLNSIIFWVRYTYLELEGTYGQ